MKKLATLTALAQTLLIACSSDEAGPIQITQPGDIDLLTRADITDEECSEGIRLTTKHFDDDIIPCVTEIFIDLSKDSFEVKIEHARNHDG